MAAPLKLAEDDLGPLGPELGAGNQATVFDAPDLRLPGCPAQLVYKRYKQGQAPDPRTVQQLIDLRAALDPPRRTQLDRVTVWPLRTVWDGDKLRGVVLPRIPESFFQDVLQLASRDYKRKPRDVQFLFIDPARLGPLGLTVPTLEQRLRACRDLAAALALLHAPPMAVVFRDISYLNELYRLAPEPTVMLVDCDAVRPPGAAPTLDSPDWEPPERAPVSSWSTDRYKLGLFVLRCLTPGVKGTIAERLAEAVTVLDAQGGKLLAAAVDGPPSGRPSADDWCRYLDARFNAPASAPVSTAHVDLPVPVPMLPRLDLAALPGLGHLLPDQPVMAQAPSVPLALVWAALPSYPAAGGWFDGVPTAPAPAGRPVDVVSLMTASPTPGDYLVHPEVAR